MKNYLPILSERCLCWCQQCEVAALWWEVIGRHPGVSLGFHTGNQVLLWEVVSWCVDGALQGWWGGGLLLLREEEVRNLHIYVWQICNHADVCREPFFFFFDSVWGNTFPADNFKQMKDLSVQCFNNLWHCHITPSHNTSPICKQ